MSMCGKDFGPSSLVMAKLDKDFKRFVSAHAVGLTNEVWPEAGRVGEEDVGLLRVEVNS